MRQHLQMYTTTVFDANSTIWIRDIALGTHPSLTRDKLC